MQRVATELVRALDAQRPPGRWMLLCPPGARPLELAHIEQRTVGPSGWPGHLWEQAVLPAAAREGWLVSLAGAAPAFAVHDFAMIHDAAVFDHPEAYRRPFVLWYRWLFRRLAGRQTRLMTVSEFSRQRLAQWLAVDEDRIAVLRPGAGHLAPIAPDPDVIDRLGLDGRPFFLAVGSLNPTKGLDRLVQAWQGLPPGRPALVLVGGRDDRVFSSSALPDGLVHAGAVTDAALVALYRHALALVFPSTYEGYGLPPLEAMSCGCPVAAARVAAIPEACGEAALYFDPASTQGLQQALARLIGDAPLRERLRAAGLVQAASRRWDDAATGLRALLGAQGALA